MAQVDHDVPEDYRPLHKGEVDLGTGLYIRRDEDLVVRGTPPIVLRRAYQSLDTRSRAFGVGASHAFESFIIGDASRFQRGAIVLEDGSRIDFDRISPGTSYRDALLEHRSSPTDYFGAQLGWTGVDWAMRKVDGSVDRFESCGRANKARPCGLIMSRDADGHEIHGRRDDAGRLLRIEASRDRWIAFDYDRSDRVTRAYDSTGAEVHYGYDERGFLTLVKAPGGVERRYGYSASGQLETITEPDIFIENLYDSNGRCVRQVNRFPGRPNPFIFDLSYTMAGDKIRQAEIKRSDGSWTTMSFSPTGYMISEVWGRAGVSPTTVVWERDPRTAVVTSLQVTCVARDGLPLTYSQTPEPGGEEYARFDLIRTHCGWDEASLVLWR